MSKSSVAAPATLKTIGYAANSAQSSLAPFSFERREPGPRDMRLKFFTVGSATLTCIPRAMNGRAPFIPACPDMKSLGV